MAQHTYRISLAEEPEKGYTVNVPALPGCITMASNTFGERIRIKSTKTELTVMSFMRSKPVEDAQLFFIRKD